MSVPQKGHLVLNVCVAGVCWRKRVALVASCFALCRPHRRARVKLPSLCSAFAEWLLLTSTLRYSSSAFILLLYTRRTMLLHRLRFSAPLGALSRSKLLQIGSNSRVETQLPPTPMPSARSSLPNRSFGTSCCPKPAPTGAADAHSASDLGPVPSFLMSQAIRYSQVMVFPASPSFSRNPSSFST